jgi:hypothetical protein
VAAFIGAGPVYSNSIERHACFCSSMQFFHRRSSVAYHTIIHLLFPFIQALRAISHPRTFSSYQQSFPLPTSPSLRIVQSLPRPREAALRAHIGTPLQISSPQQSSYHFHFNTRSLHATSTSTPLQVSQILPASSVPRSHVLLHAVVEIGRLCGRDGRAGVGDRALEAVLVDFL